MMSKMIYVALLRGINVGGNSIVSMARLKESFEKLGYKNVTTYINSGNVIFSASHPQRILEEDIEQELDKTFHFSIRVVVRSLDEIRILFKHIPSKWHNQTDWRHNIIFLSHRIDNKESFKDFVPKPHIEEMKYFPGVLLWSAKTSDLTKSTILKNNRSPLYKEMTVRGLNTTKKIFDLMTKLEKN